MTPPIPPEGGFTGVADQLCEIATELHLRLQSLAVASERMRWHSAGASAFRANLVEIEAALRLVSQQILSTADELSGLHPVAILGPLP